MKGSIMTFYLILYINYMVTKNKKLATSNIFFVAVKV
jgi:hypothetical protein